MLAKDIGIDLGTANVLIYVKGEGIVLNEPSVVALDQTTNKVLAVGKEAYAMIGRTPRNIVTIRPLQDGVIADFNATEWMLRHFLHQLNVKGLLTKPKIFISCPSNITSVEQKAIRETAEKSGGKTIYLEEEPKVAAIGAGMDIFEPSGNMVVDIGGGTTDAAVLSMGAIVTASSVKMAGDKLSGEIATYIKKEYKLLIGERTAEDVKVKIGSVAPGGRKKDASMEIYGRDMVNGLPRALTVTSEEIEKVLKEPVDLIIKTARGVLEKTPPELAADIIDRGVILTGGGALLHGIDQLLAEELKVPVTVAENPMESVVMGTGKMIDNLNDAVKIKAV
ncbi:rod shape-determining protein MreB [Bacillus thermotolerans]|uniref:Cell shape-determining protein MreB n=1 Tax=Bacillus thermotolerans TaxID=1221996 RepID=A0A0F5I6S1_BACTR|nr:rod shape-determining protein MreB [Bacillus thermotolerans]KKB36543.1 MreB-like protein [Bacillus thermotolerans]KKB40990.1 MreB-like protein (Mbl protein) [Bacillus thermotolerans]KKB44944.1 MreB-like protein [Bacillus thermotolerans]